MTAALVADSPTAARKEGRLAFVDGLRGIAALVVMVGHTLGMADHADALDHRGPLSLLFRPFLFGEQMVWLFILLSGFALYWSEDHRRAQGMGATTLAAYARRRSWRILPTYYVALAVGFAVVVPLGGLLAQPSQSLRTYQPVTVDGLLSHLALMHTLEPGWAHQFNPPLWSIAFEVQLYVLFPVLLTMVARRVPALLACVVLMCGVEVADKLLHLPVFGLAAWFFAGVVCAHAARHRQLPHRVLVTAAVCCILLGLARLPRLAAGWSVQGLWMAAFACLVTGLVGASSGGRWNLPTHPLAVWLGHRSYSLYAVHFPVLLLVWAAVSRWGLPDGREAAVVLVIGVPAAVLAAQILYRSVERPALTRMRTAEVYRKAAVLP